MHYCDDVEIGENDTNTIKISQIPTEVHMFTLACSQASINSDIYLFSPLQIKMISQGRNCALKLKQNLCGL